MRKTPAISQVLVGSSTYADVHKNIYVSSQGRPARLTQTPTDASTQVNDPVSGAATKKYI